MAISQQIDTNSNSGAPATEFLDHQFPLRTGTHSDVCSYLVYFDHLLAIKSDGSTTSLVTPSQFQDSDGCLDGPNAILLSDGTTHVEIRLCNAPKTTDSPHQCIDDIRIETILAAC